MWDKVDNTHSSTIQSVPEYYKTQKMCDKAFNKSFLAYFYILDEYKTQQISDKAVDDCLDALKFVLD